MKRIHIIAAVVALILLYGFASSSDLDAQERAEAHAQEARAAARIAARQLARELRMRGAFDDGAMVRPVAKLGE